MSLASYVSTRYLLRGSPGLPSPLDAGKVTGDREAPRCLFLAVGNDGVAVHAPNAGLDLVRSDTELGGNCTTVDLGSIPGLLVVGIGGAVGDPSSVTDL